MSLLTDPRLCDDDYLFFDDNPLQPLPKDITEIRDLNTGEAYKPTKKAAMLTQKDQKTFDRQTATRLDEVNLLLLAALARKVHRTV